MNVRSPHVFMTLTLVALTIVVSVCMIQFLPVKELPHVSIESTPAGASVFLNGRLCGSTPLSVEGFKNGTYSLRLEKTGYQAFTRDVTLAPNAPAIASTLQPWPTGKILVEVNPPGCEVLLNGQSVGTTPVLLDPVPVGRHILEVRKTNFESFMQVADVLPGGSLKYSGFELRDKILAMLEGLVRSEPWRVNPLIELGHYQFLAGRIDEAVATFGNAIELSQTPLQLPQPYSPDELEIERRWRDEDVRRLNEELQKTRNWQGRDTAVFREKLEKTQRTLEDRYINDWAHVYDNMSARVRNREFPRAEELLQGFMKAVPDSPQIPRALMELFDVRLNALNLNGSRETAQALMTRFPAQWERLKEAGMRGKIMFGYKRYQPKDNVEVGALSMQLAQASLKTAPTPADQKLCSDLIAELQKLIAAP